MYFSFKAITYHVTYYVTCVLYTGNLDPSSSGDVLVVGSQTHILAYDVEKNAELFYNEVSVRPIIS